MLQFKKMQMNFISFYFLVLFYLSINPSSDHLFMHSFIYLYGRSSFQFLLSFCLFIFCRSFFIYLFFFIVISLFKFTFSLSYQQEKANVILPLQKLLDRSCFIAFHKVTAIPVFQTFEDYVPARLRCAQSGSTAYMCT